MYVEQHGLWRLRRIARLRQFRSKPEEPDADYGWGDDGTQ